MSTPHKVGSVAELFDVSSETVRRWAQEFENYLSTNANPKSGQTRLFQEEDLSVFALVAEVKDRGGTYDDAHARLRSGERGIVPDEPVSKVEQKVAINQLYNNYKALETERDGLQKQVELLSEELQSTKEEVARMNGRDEMHERTERELKESRERIETLVKQVARLEVLLEIEQEKGSGNS